MKDIRKYFSAHPGINLTQVENLAGIDRLQEFLNGEDTLSDSDIRSVLTVIDLIRNGKIKEFIYK